MTRPQRSARRYGGGVWAVVVCLAVLTGCSEDGGGADGAGRGARPTAAGSSSAGGDEEFGERVRKALGTESIDDSDPLFVESGLERVGDGIHARPKLRPGTVYEVVVACAGKGRIDLSIAGKGPTHRTVDCDGVPTTARTTGARDELRLDATGRSGAAGMVGWRISEVAGGAG
ncbi:hypothetical protein ACOBQB_26695 [Streptomyces sp. G5(2025)]|uniref:hypothetical protein n=1 Tax=Streptomyces sp. G5(2025) TaxID=3406628 RepID=UPI003C2914F6